MSIRGLQKRISKFVLPVALIAGLGLTGIVNAQNTTPPGYANKVRQYRNEFYAGAHGAENVNLGIPRSISTFLPPEMGSTTNFIYVPNTAMVTNDSSGVYAAPGMSTGLVSYSESDIPIRSMSVTVTFYSSYPLQDLQIRLAKDNRSVILKDYVGTTRLGSQNQGTITFNQGSLDSLDSLASFISFTNSANASVKLAGGSDFSAFTNQSAKGNWTCSIASSSTSQSSNVLSSFRVDIESDPKAAMSIDGGKTYNLTPRAIAERNPTIFDSNGNEVPAMTRAESER